MTPATPPAPTAILQTAHLRLRPPTLADAPAIFATYAQDPQVTRYLVWRPHRDVSETVAFLQRCERAWRERNCFPWALELLATRQLIGMIELRVAPEPPAKLAAGAEAGAADDAAAAVAAAVAADVASGGSVEVGYVLAQPHWGRGYVAEALEAVIDAARALPGVRRVWALVDVDNFASQRVLEKGGLRREALLPRRLVHPNIGPEPRDAYRYARAL